MADGGKSPVTEGNPRTAPGSQLKEPLQSKPSTAASDSVEKESRHKRSEGSKGSIVREKGVQQKQGKQGAAPHAPQQPEAQKSAAPPNLGTPLLRMPPPDAAMPTTPRQLPQHSSSLPPTPYNHARKPSDDFRHHLASPMMSSNSSATSTAAPTPSPSISHETKSPRSARSESESNVRPSVRAGAPPAAPFTGGCKYETGLSHSRRRIPYSIGGDLLSPPKNSGNGSGSGGSSSTSSGPKKALSAEDEKKLNGDMRELYDRILPTGDSEHRRARFVAKLERILNEKWPGNGIKVHVFGSSGNLLCSNDSDVDICITSSLKVLERTCNLAKALAERGMERVVCVPSAKVPIVKIWDPELELACDMNVNNTLALENTRMIRTYVQADPRVRPLAMVIKHWTRKRVLNDAALGGTLSSYTWICLIINFLQTREPKILPNLQKMPELFSDQSDGSKSAFADNLEALQGFGKENKESIGELLFHFFRRYGYEIDFEKWVVSIREGCLIPKSKKNWHLMTNNRLCVEEPFNTDRNLGNTADDISWRGVHLELRRAFDLISQAKLADACSEFVFPPEVEKIWHKPVAQPPLRLTRSLSQQSRTGRTSQANNSGNRGGKNRGGGPNRRASSAAAGNKMHGMQNNGGKNGGNMPPTSHIHEQLFHQYAILQAQEQQLRLHLQQTGQSQYSPHLAHFASAPPTSFLQQSAFESGRRQSATGEPGTPLSAPLQMPLRTLQNYYPNASLLRPAMGSPTPQPSPGAPSASTNPPSPALSNVNSANDEQRRGVQRSNTTGSNVTSPRSHSQPPGSSASRSNSRSQRNLHANVMMSPAQHAIGYLHQYQQFYLQTKRAMEASQSPIMMPHRTDSPSQRVTVDPATGMHYIGYYVDPQQLQARSPAEREGIIPPYALHPDMDGRSRRYSTSPNAARTDAASSRSPSPTTRSTNYDYQNKNESSYNESRGMPIPTRQESGASSSRRGSTQKQPRSGPLIVDGTSEDPGEAHRRAPPWSYDGQGDFHEPHTPSNEQMFMPAMYGDMPIAGTAEHQFMAPMGQYHNGHGMERRSPPGTEPPPGFTPQSHASNVLQFGEFPARMAPGRRSGSSTQTEDQQTPGQPTSPRRSSSGSQQHSSMNGLGIEFTRPDAGGDSGSAQQGPSPGLSSPSRNANAGSSNTGNGNSEAPLKSVPLLSPVREVRTPSPTIARNNSLSNAAGSGNEPRLKTNISLGGKETASSPLSKSYHATDKGKEKENSEARSNGAPPKPSSPPGRESKANTVKEQTSKPRTSPQPQTQAPKQAPAPTWPQPTSQHQKQASTSASTASGAAAPANSAPPPQPLQQQQQPAASGWQQSVSKKTRKNRKSASLGSVPLNLDEGGRKGG